ncbi:MAG: 16S rRNA (guanine(527)-N(7))-methyltransferase RsmG [Actinomycetota bacterium]|nr:16S rRNA (guanine(527)-N(7))-methyltransferase RsmG [Actinomycetota bacterium]
MSALRSRISRLVAEFALPEGAGRQLRALLDVMQRDPSAPTTVTDPARGVEAHIVDSLDGLRLSAVRDARSIADLGAGAGFPGLVLAVALPAARVRLVDSVGRKCDFMARAAAGAGLRNAETVHARAEDWPGGIERHDLVTARAVAPLAVVVEYAAPLLALDGRLVAWKGLRDPREEADGRAAAAATGLEVVETVAVPPRPGADHRHLHVYAKVSSTPARFPRRPGMARKRPLEASS